MKISSLALVLWLAVVSGGAAQDDPMAPLPSETSSEYRQLVQQALDEFQRGNWDEAAGLFGQAHRISPSARTLRGMGLSAFEGRRYVDSLDHLRAALLSTVNPLTDKQRQEIEETIARAEKYVAKLQLTVTPESAEVYVNDEPVPNDGGERLVILDPGLVEVRAVSPGHQLALRQLRMVSGAHQHLELRLAPASGAAVSGGSGAKVDGGRGGFPYNTFGWLSVGLAGASAVGSFISWQVREDAAKEFNRESCRNSEVQRTDSSTCSGLADQVTSAETAIVVTAVASGVFIGTAVLFFVLDGTQDDDEASAQACGAGPGELGVQCRMRF
jgi:hypothetical protein